METNYFQHPRRFPANAPGPFYTTGHESPRDDTVGAPLTWCGDCLWCGAPEAEAPQLFAPFDDSYTDTYFVRQPENADELTTAINSTAVCCVFAIRYGGRDRSIIDRLQNDPEVCDYIVAEDGELALTVDTNGDLLPFAQEIADVRRQQWQRSHRGVKKQWWRFWQ